MLIMGVETSGHSASVAICRNEKLLGERLLPKSRVRHAQQLLVDVRELLRECSLSPKDLEAVAVSQGPGSFTGLRIGVVFAKTLAYATGCPLTAVDTFLCLAHNALNDTDRVQVVADAQRGDLFTGTYRRVNSCWQAVEAIGIQQADAWASTRTDEDVILGPGVSRYRDLLTKGTVLPDDAAVPQARVVAAVGLAQVMQGQTVPCFDLEPFYLRPSAAEEKRKQQADPDSPAD